ncbi:unnamed protein product [Phytophthora fragariaefolia]|uniref:Unnamed protein product n=1 Tax=Phytophthora fragariaefolia TaxID=1490495 RepID=A0A9W6YNJ6_9STRA|nr:unnamed protein product [Phytophthora fragariaefolia]
MGDFSVPLDALMDEVNPYGHDLGRNEFISWQLRLGVIDAWRNTYPDRREFTGPGRKNRIGYCFLSTGLLTDYLNEISHVTDQRFNHEDHLPVRFHLKSPDHPTTAPLPWKCPRWILENPVVQRVLRFNLDQLCNKLRCDITANPGALLDEHKRADAIFLREMTQSFRNQVHETVTKLKQALYKAEFDYAELPTAINKVNLAAAQADLAIQLEVNSARRQRAKFDSDIKCGEIGGKHFFRRPFNAEMNVVIPNVTLEDGTTTTDPELMTSAHRRYWGEIFQSPSIDFDHDFPQRRFSPIVMMDLLDHTTARLSAEDKRFLDAPMTANGFYWAIQTTAKGKSSGLDGIPAEYYQLFPDKWAQDI